MNTDTINDATSDTAEDHVATDAAVEAAGAETVVAAAPAAAAVAYHQLPLRLLDSLVVLPARAGPHTCQSQHDCFGYRSSMLPSPSNA